MDKIQSPGIVRGFLFSLSAFGRLAWRLPRDLLKGPLRAFLCLVGLGLSSGFNKPL
jgi:hypothetical protein